MIGRTVLRWLKPVTLSVLLGLGTLGCAREPTLQSVAFREFGVNSIVLKPQQSTPHYQSKEYLQNDFRYVPGSLAAPASVANELNLLRGRAESWNIVAGLHCQQTIVNLHRALKTTHPDIVDDYRLDATFPGGLFSLFDWASVRQTYSDLNDNEFGKLRRVTITLKRVKSFELDESRLDQSLAQIKKSSCYRELFAGYTGRYIQVGKVYIADVKRTIESSDGIKIALGPLSARNVSGLRYLRSGNQLMVAIVPR